MKKLFSIIFAVLILQAIPLVAYSHSGGTDSNGGHYNHSTGEYHFHHGYSAHDHYDMDGDGDVDCPYNFANNSYSSVETDSTEEPSSPATNTCFGYHFSYEQLIEYKLENYNDGYEAGHSAGYQEARTDLSNEYDKKLSDALQAQKENTYYFFGLIVAPILILITAAIIKCSSNAQIKCLKTENDILKKQLYDKNEAAYVLDLVVAKAGTTRLALAESLFVNFRKAAGLSEEAARSEFHKEMQKIKKRY